jgi:hypothetical protein
MATDPVFYTLPNIGFGIVPGTADTSLTAPSNVTTVFTAAANANGSKIERIRVNQVVDSTTDGVVNIFIHDGSTYHLFEVIPFTSFDITPNVQQPPDKIFDKAYDDVLIENAWTLRATVTAAGGQSAYKVIVFGLDAA